MLGWNWRTPVGAAAAAAFLIIMQPGAAQAQITQHTVSSGEIQIFNYEYDGRRNDTYQVNIIARVDGIVLYDQTFFRSRDDPGTQAGFAAAAQPRAYALGGAPAIVVWSDPVLTEAYEEFLDSFTEYSVFTRGPTLVTTVQTTSGDAPDAVVYSGQRGTCYDTGVTGSTNTPPFDGAFASCDFFDEHIVDPGTVNINTHTSYIYEIVERSFTNDDYLNLEFYELTGTAILIGAVHAEVQTGLYESGAGFSRRLLAGGSGGAPMTRSGRVGLWVAGYGGRSGSDSDAFGPGSRRSQTGAAGGLIFAASDAFHLGLAVDRNHGDVNVRNAPEEATARLTHVGLSMRYVRERWQARAGLGHGWGRVRTERGDDSIGGASEARYDASVLSATVEAGPILRVGRVAISPWLGAEWLQARTGEFAETGGIPLSAERHKSERLAASVGLDLSREWDLANGSAVGIAAQGRLGHVLDGAERTRPVSFTGSSLGELRVRGASDASTTGSAALGVMFRSAGGVGLHAVADGRIAGGEREWRLMGGVSLAL